MTITQSREVERGALADRDGVDAVSYWTRVEQFQYVVPMENIERGRVDQSVTTLADRMVEKCVMRLEKFDFGRRAALSKIEESLTTAVSMLQSVGYADTSKIRHCIIAAQAKLAQENQKLADQEAARDVQ